ncbi:chromate transporter [Hydrogenophaga sp. 5NK40-0174]|uniref:chromate transporter n=1 Tax=Hydrogenophaga sp. 5NK40-0174 TaxID=3127649 RepID=UPI00310734E5
MTLAWDDWLSMFVHFLSLSLLAVGGAITTAPEMHRYLVGERGWLTDGDFGASIALAQAAPGPNVLFVPLLGWHLGMGASAALPDWHPWWLAGAGAFVAMFATLLPSSILTYSATQWGHRNRHLRSVRAFKAGLAPIVIALLVATGWLIAVSSETAQPRWHGLMVTAVAAVLVWKTRLHLLVVLAGGAVAGMLGFV